MMPWKAALDAKRAKNRNMKKTVGAWQPPKSAKEILREKEEELKALALQEEEAARARRQGPSAEYLAAAGDRV